MVNEHYLPYEKDKKMNKFEVIQNYQMTTYIKR